jgi:DNA relaxase NicK
MTDLFPTRLNPVKQKVDAMILRSNNTKSQSAQVSQNAVIPPYANRGGKSLTPLPQKTQPIEFTAIVDWLSFSFKLYSQSEKSSHSMIVKDDWALRNEMDEHLAEISNYIEGLCFRHTSSGGKGYKYKYNLYRHDKPCGMAYYGGNNGTAYIELSGVGCELVDFSTFSRYVETLNGCKLKRVDLAHDDFEGNRGFAFWLEKAHQGLFAGRGRPPSYRTIINSDHGKGNTLYVGHKANGQELCGYEKGKQLGDEKSPWFRLEGRITAVDRVIPFETLTQPAKYLAGMYPILSILSDIYEKIRVVRDKFSISLESLQKYARLSYGRLISYMDEELNMTGHEICEVLRRPGSPSRLVSAHNMGWIQA